MNNQNLERKYSSTLIVVNYLSDHPPISAKGINGTVSAGFRWWGALGIGVVGGPSMCGSDIESLGRAWPIKSLGFPQIINIHDVIL